LQLSSGAVSPLDALGGLQEGFSRAEVGLLGSAHFIGFFIGCWWAPRLLSRVGYSRGFAAFAACGAIGTIAHPLQIDPLTWGTLRIMTGLSIAGCYTVVEAWMHARVTNENRGRVLGAYRTVDLVASLGAQLLIVILVPASWVSYNILGILCCACLFPLVLTRLPQPQVPKAPRLKPFKTLRVSPLGAAGAVVAGVTAASFRMVGPIYGGQEVGLRADQIGYFLAAFVLGGAISQLPAGWLADKFDRRQVMIVVSLLAVGASAITVGFGTTNIQTIFAAAMLFGFVTFPLYSLATAHANDFATDAERIELSASLLFMYGVGAIASPYLTSVLIEHYGPSALFILISIAHIALAVFGLLRMRRRPTTAERTPYRYLPRTSFILDRLFRRSGR